MIDEITPYYKPEAIEQFNKILRDKQSLRVKIIEKKKALKNMVKSFQVDIIELKDTLTQFFYTKPDVAKELESILQKEGGMKAQVTLKIILKKKRWPNRRYF